MTTKLFSEFKKTSDQDWIDKVQKDLKGKDIHSLSSFLPYEEIELKAIYSKSDHSDLPIIKYNSDWEIRENDNKTLDPIALLCTTGDWNKNKDDDFDSFFSSFKGSLIVNASVYGATGASAVQELTYSISQLNEYLNHINDKSLKLEHLELQLSIVGEYFINIAKFRAIRILILNLLKTYGIKSDILKVHASNNSLYFSSKDINTNILRSTTQCMSAVLGGVDSISIFPHNCLIETDENFGKRVAKNLQHLLKHEAHLDKVSDPSSGSYFLDNLTAEMSKICWEKFKNIEAKGGFTESFLQGGVQKDIYQTLQKRIDRARSGEDTLIGINKYHLEEIPNDFRDNLLEDKSLKLTPINIEALI